MELVLKCHFSYINQYNAMRFICDDEESIEKLATHCNIQGEFTIHGGKQMPMDELVGRDCIVRVRLQRYCFTAKGQLIRGVKLNLVKIAPIM